MPFSIFAKRPHYVQSACCSHFPKYQFFLIFCEEVDHHFSKMEFWEATTTSRLYLLMTFEKFDDQQADIKKCSILSTCQNCTKWLFREHFSKVVKDLPSWHCHDNL